MSVAAGLGTTIATESLNTSTGTRFLQGLVGWWQRIRRVSSRQPKRLRLCENLPLGERRFVAVVEFEQSRFLIGGTQGSMVLLAPLHRAEANQENGALAAQPAPAMEVRS